MNKKILYLVTEDWYFWSHRLHLAQSALKNDYLVILATNEGKYLDKIRAKGFDFIPVSIHRSVGSVFREIGTFIKLLKIYNRCRPDLVHHISLKPVFIGTLSAWMCRIPCIVNSYTGLGFLFTTGNSWKSFIFLKLFLPLTAPLLRGNKIWSIVQNPDDREDLRKYGLLSEQRTIMIRGSGVDVTSFSYSDEQESSIPVVMFASRLLRTKGIFEFIEAAGLIRDKKIPARFVVIGDIDEGNPTSIKREQLDEWIHQGCIEYWGYQDDIAPAYRQAHIICFPSYREGLPKVLLEAAATGRPIVAFDVPGCREIVRHEENGLLVPVKDTGKLVSSIIRLLQDRELRVKMGWQGRRLVEQYFSIETITEQTLDLYRSALAPSDRL